MYSISRDDNHGFIKPLLTVILVLLGQADIAMAQCQNATIPIVVSVFVMFVVLLVTFAVILYFLRRRWKQNGQVPKVQQDELREVITEQSKPEPPSEFQVKAVESSVQPVNGKVSVDDGSERQVHTYVLNKASPTNGFNIVADKDGNIFVRDIRKDGPAAGKLLEADVIESVTVFYEGISYEDALNILSYAAPYKVAISLVRTKNPMMPGMDINKSDPFVEELQKQLEKRGNSKGTDHSVTQPSFESEDPVAVSMDSPTCVPEENKKPHVQSTTDEQSSNSTSTTSSSEDEKSAQVEHLPLDDKTVAKELMEEAKVEDEAQAPEVKENNSESVGLIKTENSK